jgi:FAD/FMN-containing dehydrogenase
VPPTTPTSRGPAGEVDEAQWTAFGRSLSGRLVRPDSPGYLTDLQLYDSRFDSVRPMGIAYCASPTDVQRSVSFARENALPFAARSGGHSYGGYSTSTGLIVDVTEMSTVQMSGRSSAGGTATIGAGARLIDVYSTLNGAGVSIPAGSCPTVGIAGLALGGGVGVVDRAYGLTCDAVRSLQVVTADSRAVTASPNSNPDLYWACRGGGGGNFGIVTSLTLQTFPTAPLTLVFLSWSWSEAPQVLPAWLEWAPVRPDQLWSNCLLEAAPAAAAPTLQVGVVWQGAPAGVESHLSALISAAGSQPSSRYSETVPFSHAMYVEGGCAAFSQAACHLPTQNPAGALTRQPSLAKSGYVRRPFNDAGVAGLIAGIDARQASRSQGAAGFDAYGGAINRIPAAATAFVHRSAMASVQYNVPFAPGTPAAELASSQQWLDSLYASLTSQMDGEAYQNYIDPALPNWPTAYYGSNLAGLKQVKRTWDPDGTFRFPQSIPV